MIKGCLFSHLTSVTFLWLSFFSTNMNIIFLWIGLKIAHQQRIKSKVHCSPHQKKFPFLLHLGQTWCQNWGWRNSLSWHNKKKIEGNRDWNFIVISSVGTWKCFSGKLHKNTSWRPKAHHTANHKRWQFHFATSSTFFSPRTQKSWIPKEKKMLWSKKEGENLTCGT